MISRRWTAVAMILGVTLAAPANAATRVNSFKDWSVFAHEQTEKKICFAASQPKTTLPRGANRDPIFFYVSSWPGDGIKSEISVRLGYPIKPDSAVSITIGTDSFELFAKGDKAFVADQMRELKLIDAMKKGSTMTVQAVSTRGTRTSDAYSLMGISDALTQLSSTCK